jgi:hypothetical protein
MSDNKQYISTHHPGGWPRIWNYDSFWRRVREAWWILTDRQSLHRAWQSGYDQHIRDDAERRARSGN